MNAEKRGALVHTAQCWLDVGLDKDQSQEDRWHGLMNAYNHTENALYAAREALERLGSNEAFDVATSHIPKELDMRMEFARAALETK